MMKAMITDKRMVEQIARHFEKADGVLARLAQRGNLDGVTYIGKRLEGLREEFEEVVALPAFSEQ
jgi:hypothetical protein